MHARWTSAILKHGGHKPPDSGRATGPALCALMDEKGDVKMAAIDDVLADLTAALAENMRLEGEVERLTKEIAEVRRQRPELEAQATVRGYNDGVAEMKRKLGALNIRLGADG